MKTETKLAIVLSLAAIVAVGSVLWLWQPWNTRESFPRTPGGLHHPGGRPDQGARPDNRGAPLLAGPWRIHVKGEVEAVNAAVVVLALRSGEWVKAEPLSPGLYRPGVSRGSVDRLFAVAHGWRSPSVKPSGVSEDITLVLEPSADLAVRVEDASGQPVDAVRLTVSLADVDTPGDWLKAVELGLGLNVARILTTDADGVALLPALLPGSWVQVMAQNDNGVATGEIADLALNDNILLKLEDGGTRVSVRCRRLDGSAVPALALQYQLVAGSPDNPFDAGRGAFSTDEAGIARMFLGDAAALFLTGVEPGWRFHERPLALSADRLETDVTVVRVFPLVVRVTYEDGRPYRGNASLWADSRGWSVEPVDTVHKGRGGGQSDTLPIDETGTFTLPRVVEGESVELTAFPEGVEYGGVFNATHTVADGDSVWEVVFPKLPKERTPGVIRLTGAGAESGRVVIIDDPWGNPMESFSLSDKKTSRGLPERSYRVRISGPKIGWESEVFALQNGNVKELQVPAQAPGSVRVLITDKEGSPLEGAAITPWSRTHAVFPMDPQPYVFAFSGRDGVAVLEGQPPGRRKYRIEAASMQFRAETTDIFSNEVSDLGRIALSPATGEVWITVTGTISAGERIDLKLKTPFGPLRTATPWVTGSMQDGKGGFAELVVERRYIIALTHRDSRDRVIGGYVINGVHLTTEQSALEYTINLSDFRQD
jgi:hypothetical protein